MHKTLFVIHLLLISPVLALAQGGTGDFRSFSARVDHETDPVRKAKLIRQLQPDEFKAVSKAFSADKLQNALAMLQEFAAEAQSCENELEARGVDAEKHPTGFKELQIAVREALRTTDDLLVTITSDEQQPFAEVHGQLNDTDLRLIHELFPSPKRAEKAERKESK